MEIGKSMGALIELLFESGENISLDHIEKFLSQNEYVNACLVKSQDDEEWGKVLVAYVVASNANLEKIISYAKQGLPQFHVPKIWKVCLKIFPYQRDGKTKNLNFINYFVGESVLNSLFSIKVEISISILLNLF